MYLTHSKCHHIATENREVQFYKNFWHLLKTSGCTKQCLCFSTYFPVHTGIMCWFSVLLYVWKLQMWRRGRVSLQLWSASEKQHLSMWLPQLNCIYYVTWFREKHFNSQYLCLLPLLCCCSYCLWQLNRNGQPDWDYSEFSPRKQPPSPPVRVSQGPLFDDVDYVIM